MDLVKKSITCKYCHNLFHKPVFLPCHNTLCSAHIDDEIAKTNNNYSIMCFFCKHQHKIPKEGFKENELARDLIQSGSHFTDEEKHLKTETEKLNTQLNNLYREFEKREPEIELFNLEYFANIRNKIEIQREQLKIKIDKVAEKMLDETKEFENRYKQKLIDFKIDNQMINKDQLNKMKLFLDNHFRNPNLDLNKVELLKAELVDKITKFQDKLNDFEMIKVNIRDCVFKPNEVNLPENFLGHITLNIDYQLISCSVYCIELLLNRELATGSFDKTIKIWNIESGMCIKTINTSSCVFALKQLSVNELIR